MRRVPFLGLLLAVVASSSADAQSAAAGEVLPVWADSFVVIAPGPRYTRSAAVEALLGRHYRELWATRIRVPVLDLGRFAGGLKPVRAHAGSQTRSLRFEGADGRTYQFRAVDKDPTALLAPELRTSIAGRVLQDGASSSHPVGSLVASALLEAAGVLHVEQTLVVLPNDASLGEYRADFGGMFGMIEERPDETADRAAAFAGARQVISPTRLFERIDRSPDDRVDARAFLVARLMDILMGDRDRHRDQFRWARRQRPADSLWQPISRDHDEAFVKIDGPALRAAAYYYPPLVSFDDEYPPHDRLNWHSREVDRRFLVELDRHVWDSVATALQVRLTDSVLDAAVRRLPGAMYDVGGAAMARRLRVRRDHLRDEALSYYAFLAHEVEIRATDAAEVAVIDVGDRHVDVRIGRAGAGRPYFARRFEAGETREIRLKTWGGADRVVVRGTGRSGITLRVSGGAGDDALIDSSEAGGIRFYDDPGNNTVSAARGDRVDRRPYVEWVGSDTSRYPPREWGTWWRPLPWVSVGSDVGLLVGAGFTRTRYGFRRSPYASELSARIGYATGLNALRGELTADVRRENQTQYWTLRLEGSGMDLSRYYGSGNATEPAGSTDFHRVGEQVFTVEPAAAWSLGTRTALSAGPVARWSRTSANDGRFIAAIQDTLYGAGHFGEVGGRAAFVTDRRDKALNPRRGTYLSVDGAIYPELWDVAHTFGSLHARAETYLSATAPLTPVLALRVDGKKLWGTFPFQESAFLGGPSSLRGYDPQRFAGDASLSGSAELRLTVGHTEAVLPALWGVFGNADAGRVWVDSRSPGGWHTGVGGGVWVALLDRANTASIGLTTSREMTAFHAGFGFAF